MTGFGTGCTPMTDETITWVCRECPRPCKLERCSYFPPERCVYNERPEDRKAKWMQVL